MKYLIAMFNDEGAWKQLSGMEQEEAVERLMKFSAALEAEGSLLLTHGLAASSEAVSIRASGDGEPTLVDGPFAETKEAIGGFYIVECGSKAEAVEILKRTPLASWGAELRQIQ